MNTRRTTWKEKIMESEGRWDRLFEADPVPGIPGSIAQDAVDKAWVAFRRGDWRRALDLCRGALRAGAKTPERFGLLVKLCRRMGLPEEALVCLDSAIGAHPSFAPWRLGRAVVLEELGRYQAALRSYEEAARLDPFSMRARLLGVGRLKMWARRYREAAGDIAPTLKVCPLFPGALRLGGALLLARRRFGEADGLLTKAVRLSPTDGEAFLLRAEARRHLGRLKTAREDAQAATRCGGSALLAAVNLALCREDPSSEDLVLVRHLLPAALKVATPRLSTRLALPDGRSSSFPGKPRVWLNQILQAVGANRSARLTRVSAGRLIACPDVHPRQEMVGLQKKLLFEKPGAVLDEFSARIKSSEGLERARWRVHRGEALLWLGDYARGLKDIATGLEYPAFRWPYIGTAGALMLLGDHAGALARVQTAVGAGAPEPVWRPWRGEIFRRLGRFEEALDDLEQAARRPSWTPSTWVNLALSLGALRRWGRQREIWTSLFQRCPFFMEEAQASPEMGAEESMRVLARALEAMRGNRSNRIFTFISSGGRFRILTVDPPPRRRS